MKKTLLIMKTLFFVMALCLIVLPCVACNQDSAHVHSYGEWEVTTHPTCGEYGLRTHFCSCGDFETEQIEKVPHSDIKTIEEVPATCGQKGLSSYTKCLACGQNITEPTELPITGTHTPMNVTGKPASCFEDGVNDGTKCSVCGEALSGAEVIPATGNHVYDSGVQTKAPAYQVKGEITYTCQTSGCGHTKVEEIPALTYQPSDIWDGTVATSFAGGTGTQSDPYLISNAKELAYLRQTVNNGTSYEGSYIKLTKDIILNDISNYANWSNNTRGLNIWTSIGTENNPFSGVFDGDDHTIRGMYCYSTSANPTCVGLFGRIKGTFSNALWANVKNLTVSEAYVYAKGTVGGIAATVSGGYTNILNVTFSGKLYGYTAGGLVGALKVGDVGMGQVSIRQCKTSGSFESNETVYGTTTPNQSYIGGAVGKTLYNNGMLAIIGFENTASVKGFVAGGVIGYTQCGQQVTSYNGTVDITITDCINRGDITNSHQNGTVGGILGFCYLYGENNSYAPIKYLSFGSCRNYGNITATGANSESGGIAGRVDFVGGWQCTDYDSWHYVEMFKLQNFGDITADYLAGGLFGSTTGGDNGYGSYSRNITFLYCLNEGAVSSDGYAGGLLALSSMDNSSTLYYNQCYNAGDIFGENNAGGIVASAGTFDEFTNIYNCGKITGNKYVGGIAGSVYSGNVFKKCYNSGSVSIAKTAQQNAKVGAIYGSGRPQIAFCYYLENSATSPNGNEASLGGDRSDTTYRLTTVKMSSLQNFSQFDSSIWQVNGSADYKYPTLINTKPAVDE